MKCLLATTGLPMPIIPGIYAHFYPVSKKIRTPLLILSSSYLSEDKRVITGYNPLTLGLAKKLKKDFDYDKAAASRNKIFSSLKRHFI